MQINIDFMFCYTCRFHIDSTFMRVNIREGSFCTPDDGHSFENSWTGGNLSPDDKWVSCATIGCFGKVSWAVLVNYKACSFPSGKTLQLSMWKYIIWQLVLHRTVEQQFIGFTHVQEKEREREREKAPLFFLTVSCLSVDCHLFQQIPPEWLSACDLPPPST